MSFILNHIDKEIFLNNLPLKIGQKLFIVYGGEKAFDTYDSITELSNNHVTLDGGISFLMPNTFPIAGIFIEKNDYHPIATVFLTSKDYVAYCYRLAIIKEMKKFFASPIPDTLSNKNLEKAWELLLSKDSPKEQP